MTVFNSLIAALRTILNNLIASPAPALAGAQPNERATDDHIWVPDRNKTLVHAPQIGVVQTEPEPDDHALFVRVHDIRKCRKELGLPRVTLTRSAWSVSGRQYAYAEAPITAMEAKLHLIKRLAHFQPVRERAGLKPIILQENMWGIGDARYDYTESVVNPFAARMQLIEHLRYFHVFRKTIGLPPVTYRENEWVLAGRTFKLTTTMVSAFEVRMRELLRLHQPIEHLSARLAAIGRIACIYMEAGFHTHCGGHTHPYTNEGLALAEAEVAEMERSFHQHTADIAAGRQAYSDLATRGSNLPPLWKLRITIDGDNFVINGTERLSLANHRELNTRITQMENNARFAAELAKLASRRRDCGLPAITCETDGYRLTGNDTLHPYDAVTVQRLRYQTGKATPPPPTIITRFVPDVGAHVVVRRIIRVKIGP